MWSLILFSGSPVTTFLHFLRARPFAAFPTCHVPTCQLDKRSLFLKSGRKYARIIKIRACSRFPNPLAHIWWTARCAPYFFHTFSRSELKKISDSWSIIPVKHTYGHWSTFVKLTYSPFNQDYYFLGVKRHLQVTSSPFVCRSLL